MRYDISVWVDEYEWNIYLFHSCILWDNVFVFVNENYEIWLWINENNEK